MCRAHRAAENEPAASTYCETLAELMGDIEMSECVEAKPLHHLVAIFRKKASRIACAGIGYHETDIKIFDCRVKAGGSFRFREIHHDAARLDVELALQLPSEIVEQCSTARSEYHVQSGNRQLPGEFRPDP
jgi:hypothetical protein